MVVWLRNPFKELGIGDLVSKPTLMLGDNKQAGRWSRTEMVTNGNRFIERQYHKVREFVLAGDLETRYINTKLNVSDVFTKDVSREVIETLGPMLTGRAAWPPTPAAEDAMKEQTAMVMAENVNCERGTGTELPWLTGDGHILWYSTFNGIYRFGISLRTTFKEIRGCDEQ